MPISWQLWSFLPWNNVKQSSDSCFDGMKCFVPVCLRPSVCHSLDSSDKKRGIGVFIKLVLICQSLGSRVFLPAQLMC